MIERPFQDGQIAFCKSHSQNECYRLRQKIILRSLWTLISSTRSTLFTHFEALVHFCINRTSPRRPRMGIHDHAIAPGILNATLIVT